MSNNQKIAAYIAFAMDAFFDIAIPQEKAEVWAETLSGYPMEKIRQAFRDHISEHGPFKPTLAAILHQLEKSAVELSEYELQSIAVLKWEEVIESIRRYGADGYDHLDEKTKHAVRAAGGYEYIRMADTEKALPWIRKKFIEEYVILAPHELGPATPKLTDNGRLLFGKIMAEASVPGLEHGSNFDNELGLEIERERKRVMRQEFQENFHESSETD